MNQLLREVESKLISLPKKDVAQCLSKQVSLGSSITEENPRFSSCSSSIVAATKMDPSSSSYALAAFHVDTFSIHIYTTPSLMKLIHVPLNRREWAEQNNNNNNNTAPTPSGRQPIGGDLAATTTPCNDEVRTDSETKIENLVVVSKMSWIGMEYLAVGTSTGRTLIVRTHLVANTADNEADDDDDELLCDDDGSHAQPTTYQTALLGAHLVEFDALSLSSPKRTSIVSYVNYQGSYLAAINTDHKARKVEIHSVTQIEQQEGMPSPSTRVALVENLQKGAPPFSSFDGFVCVATSTSARISSFEHLSESSSFRVISLRSILLGSGAQLFSCFGWNDVTTKHSRFQFALWEDPSSIVDFTERPVLQLPSGALNVSSSLRWVDNESSSNKIVVLSATESTATGVETGPFQTVQERRNFREIDLESIFLTSLNCVTGESTRDDNGGPRARLDHVAPLVLVSTGVSSSLVLNSESSRQTRTESSARPEPSVSLSITSVEICARTPTKEVRSATDAWKVTVHSTSLPAPKMSEFPFFDPHEHVERASKKFDAVVLRTVPIPPAQTLSTEVASQQFLPFVLWTPSSVAVVAPASHPTPNSPLLECRSVRRPKNNQTLPGAPSTAQNVDGSSYLSGVTPISPLRLGIDGELDLCFVSGVTVPLLDGNGNEEGNRTRAEVQHLFQRRQWRMLQQLAIASERVATLDDGASSWRSKQKNETGSLAGDDLRATIRAVVEDVVEEKNRVLLDQVKKLITESETRILSELRRSAH